MSHHFISSLSIGSPLDVYDIHEAGWRRALLLAKRERHEYLVSYIGWDAKWDEWIRASAGRLAPANSKTAALAYTGFKGPKSADEVASIELGRDWNAARQEGVMCDVIFSVHVGPTARKPGQRGSNAGSLHGTPTKARNNISYSARKDDSESKVGASSAAAAAAGSSSNTPVTSPMMRGLSGLGIRSPHLTPLPSSSSSSGPLLFSAHRHIVEMRCPDLLKSALISLPPVTNFDEATATAMYTPYHGPRPSPGDERKDDGGGRSLADQESAAAAGAPAAIPAFALSDLSDASASPELPMRTGSIPSGEEKTRGLDEDDDMMAGSAGSLIRGNSAGMGQLRGHSELHPSVETLELSCITSAMTMTGLLTYIYTGDVPMTLLPSVKAVFDLAAAAHMLHLDRLLDLCALALNRMLHQGTFITALKCALHFQAKVLENLDTVCQDLADAQAAAAASLAGEIHASHSSVANAKVHPLLSPLVRVCLEYIILHWDTCFSSFENSCALQQLPPALFHTLLSLLPMRNLSHSPFSVIYPTVHPQACSLTSHFRRLYEERSPENTDFKIIIGDDDEHPIHVHKSVLACRSEYFRAVFRSNMEEGKDNLLRFDNTHNHASMHALIKYLYAADLKVDPHCGVYLSNCTDFFGLSSTALEHACQELVSQHHCLKVLKAAWRTCNESLFKRACKFIDWSTLATLMNGRGQANSAGVDVDAAALSDMELADALTDEEEEGAEEGAEAVDEEAEEAQAMLADAQEEGDDVPAAAAAAATPSSSPPVPHPLRHRSSSAMSSSAAAAAAAASDVEMWKAIVAEKAHPTGSSAPFGRQAQLKRARSASAL